MDLIDSEDILFLSMLRDFVSSTDVETTDVHYTDQKHYFSNSFLLFSIKTEDLITNNKNSSLCIV